MPPPVRSTAEGRPAEGRPAEGRPAEGRPDRGMIAGIIEYYRVSILAVAGLLIGGVWAFVDLPRSEDPEFDPHDLEVVALWPGVDAGQIEELVTGPLEDAVAELEDVELIKSQSAGGVSALIVRLAAAADPAAVQERIEDRLEDARRDLPAGILGPEINTYNPASIPVVLVSLLFSPPAPQGALQFSPPGSGLPAPQGALEGPAAEPGDRPAAADRRLQAWARTLERQLEALDLVSWVRIEGMPERQIQVLADSERLAQYRLPLTLIRDRLRQENAALPGGKLDVGRRRYLVTNPDQLESLEEIGDVVLGSVGDSAIRLRDVARVIDGFADPRYRVRTDRRPALLLAVGKKEGTDTAAVGRAVRRRLGSLRSSLPAGFELLVVNDRGAGVDELLGNLGRNALLGGAVVMLMVSLFLGLRQAVVVSISLPLSVLIAFLLMRLTGIDLHQISIFGLVLALGMLVDAALVVVESIALHLERREGLFAAVIAGVAEVRTPVISSVLTTTAAFFPLLFLGGDIGAFLRSMPASLIFALTGSLVVALTVVPLLCYALWRSFPPAEILDAARSPALAAYRELAKAALRRRGLTLGLALAAFVLAVAAIPRLGLQFFPQAEKSLFLINVRLPRDANLAATDLIVSRVEEILAAEPAVRDFTANIGKGGPRVYYNEVRENESPSYAQLLVNLQRPLGGRGGELQPGVGSVEAWVEGLRGKLQRISGATVEPKILAQGPNTGIAVEVRVRGDDLAVLAELAAEVRRRIATVAGITDIRDTLGRETPRLALELDKRKAALLGVDSFTFASTVHLALDGEPATLYRQGDEEVPVVVRLDPASLTEVSDLERLYLPSRFDRMVPFPEVARVVEESAFARIARRDGRRLVSVQCGVSGRLVADAAEEVRQRLADLTLPAGYDLELGGESEEREESFAGLGRAMALALLGIYVILAIQFNSFVQPFVILLTVPFGIVGAVVGLAITGHPFGFMAFVGIVSLTGILINDSIVLTDFTNYLQRVEGKRMYESLLQAGERRFRPVVLTSVTTIAGMTPLAIWGGSLWSPLACALIFGLAGATVLILIVLPVIYSLLVNPREKERAFAAWARLRRRLLRPEVVRRQSR